MAFIANGGTATINASGAVCSNLYLGDISSTNPGTLQILNGSLTATNEYLGNQGTGTINQQGGLNTILNSSGSLCVGNAVNSTGVYNLSGSGTIVAQNETIGYSGSGTFSQSGGTNNLGSSGYLYMAVNTGSMGGYTLSGSLSQLGAMSEYIGNSGSGTFTQTGGTNALVGNMYISYNAGSVGSYTLSGTTTKLVASNEYIGDSGTGSFTHSGGLNTLNGSLYIGYNAGSMGTYSTSGASLLTAQNVEVGYFGAGTFNQSSGTTTLLSNGTFDIAANANSLGNYTLGNSSSSGASATLTASTERIGLGSSGTMNQLSGTNNAGALYVGYATSGNGIYNLSGTATLSTPATEYIGYSGTGSFNQSGGTNRMTSGSPLEIAFGATSIGSYFLSGSASLQINYTEYIGNAGTGSFTQSGGTNSLGAYPLDIGQNSGAVGNYSLSDGVVTANAETVGYSGTGSISQSGGKNTCSTTLILGNTVGSAGSYNLSGTGILSAPTEQLGFNGLGAFIQSGGTNNQSTSGTLYLGYSTGSSGSYTLNGPGILNESTEYIAYVGSGLFSQSAGTNNASSLYLSYNGPISGTYNLSGSGLLVCAKEYLGYSSTGSILQSGGTNKVTNTLYVGYNSRKYGNYNLSGSGVLTSPNEYVGYAGSGSVTQTGGSNSVASTLYLGYNSSTNGIYNLSGTGFLSGQNEYLGYSGVGSLAQSGTAINVASTLFVGWNYGSSGSYTLAGASYLSASNENIGGSGSGSLLQSGGTNNVTNNLYVTSNYYQNIYAFYGLSGSGTIVANNEFIGANGSGTLAQSGGMNSVNILTVGLSGTYQFSGGTIAANYFANQGSFNMAGGSGALMITGSAIIDFSHSALSNMGSASLSIGPNALVLFPAGFNPATTFGSYSNLGAVHYAGTSFAILPGQYYMGAFNLGDFVTCQGTLTTPPGASSSLSGGVAVSGTGSVNLASGNLTTDYGALSSLTGGSLATYNEYVGTNVVGTFTHSGGTSSIAGSLYLGSNSMTAGYYNLSGSGILTAANEYVGNYGFGTFTQSGGLNATGLLAINNLSGYRFSGGTLQLTGAGLASQGGFDATGSMGVINATGNGVVDLSQATLVNAGSMALNVGANSLLILPAGFDPAASFGSYNNLGSVHYVGTTLTISPSQNFSSASNVNDFLMCQGTLAAATNLSINLNGGFAIFGAGNVNLGGGSFVVNDSLSSITSGGSFSANAGSIGVSSGTATFTQSGGLNNIDSASVGGGLYLGSNPGATGIYNLSGSASLTTYAEYIGYNGVGILNHIDATNQTNFFSQLYVGYNTGSSGIYNLSGSGLLATYDENVGYSGSGAFNQSGGTNSINWFGALYVGYNAGSSGTYSLSGSGLLATQNSYVGYSGTGVFNQTGGTNSIAGEFPSNATLYLGYNKGSLGAYNLSGSGILQSAIEDVGYSGCGSFAQSGGTNLGTSLYLGYNAGSTGAYNLSGSGIVKGSDYIGYSGTGSFVQSGGTNGDGSGSIYLGYYAGASGTYNLTGTGIAFATNEYVGYSGSGSFVQTGGTNRINGSLILCNNAGSFGSYNLSGSGVVSAANEYVGVSGSATFYQSGGSNGTNLLTIGTSGSYQYSGGTLQANSLANYGTLQVIGGPGLLSLGGSAIVDLSQASAASAATMSINVGPNSLVILPAGFNPATSFLIFSTSGLTCYVGTQLTVAPGQGFSGAGSIPNFVNCQGSIIGLYGSINLTSGVMVSGTGNASLGSSGIVTSDVASTITGGSLAALASYVGYASSGSFTQSGGTQNLSGSLYLQSVA